MSILGSVAKAPVRVSHDLSIHVAANKIAHGLGGKGGKQAAKAAAEAGKVMRRASKRSVLADRFAETFGGRAPPRSMSAAKIEKVLANPDAKLRAMAQRRGVDPNLSRAELSGQLFGENVRYQAVNAPRTWGDRVLAAGNLAGKLATVNSATYMLNSGYNDGLSGPTGLPKAVVAHTAVHVLGGVAKWLGANRAGAGLAEYGATLAVSGALGAAADGESRTRGFVRGVVQALDLSGYVAAAGFIDKPLAVAAYDRTFGTDTYAKRKGREAQGLVDRIERATGITPPSKWGQQPSAPPTGSTMDGFLPPGAAPEAPAKPGRAPPNRSQLLAPSLDGGLMNMIPSWLKPAASVRDGGQFLHAGAGVGNQIAAQRGSRPAPNPARDGVDRTLGLAAGAAKIASGGFALSSWAHGMSTPAGRARLIAGGAIFGLGLALDAAQVGYRVANEQHRLRQPQRRTIDARNNQNGGGRFGGPEQVSAYSYVRNGEVVKVDPFSRRKRAA